MNALTALPPLLRALWGFRCSGGRSLLHMRAICASSPPPPPHALHLTTWPLCIPASWQWPRDTFPRECLRALRGVLRGTLAEAAAILATCARAPLELLRPPPPTSALCLVPCYEDAPNGAAGAGDAAAAAAAAAAAGPPRPPLPLLRPQPPPSLPPATPILFARLASAVPRPPQPQRSARAAPLPPAPFDPTRALDPRRYPLLASFPLPPPLEAGEEAALAALLLPAPPPCDAATLPHIPPAQVPALLAALRAALAPPPPPWVAALLPPPTRAPGAPGAPGARQRHRAAAATRRARAALRQAPGYRGADLFRGTLGALTYSALPLLRPALPEQAPWGPWAHQSTRAPTHALVGSTPLATPGIPRMQGPAGAPEQDAWVVRGALGLQQQQQEGGGGSSGGAGGAASGFASARPGGMVLEADARAVAARLRSQRDAHARALPPPLTPTSSSVLVGVPQWGGRVWGARGPLRSSAPARALTTSASAPALRSAQTALHSATLVSLQGMGHMLARVDSVLLPSGESLWVAGRVHAGRARREVMARVTASVVAAETAKWGGVGEEG